MKPSNGARMRTCFVLGCCWFPTMEDRLVLHEGNNYLINFKYYFLILFLFSFHILPSWQFCLSSTSFLAAYLLIWKFSYRYLIIILVKSLKLSTRGEYSNFLQRFLNHTYWKIIALSNFFRQLKVKFRVNFIRHDNLKR